MTAAAAFGERVLVRVPEGEAVIGLFGDLHGNLRALHRLLRAYPEVTTWIGTGDITDADAPPYANELAVLALGHYGIRSVRGNHDDETLRSQGYRLHPDVVAALEALPHALDVAFGDLKLRVMHATPARRTALVRPGEGSLERVFAGHPADVLVLGHSHQPYDVVEGAHRFINPGPLGDPGRPPSACLLRRDGTADLVALDAAPT